MNKRMLVITPDLSLNGANVVLLELIELVQKRFTVEVMACADGEMKKKFDRMNVKCRIQTVVSKEAINTDEYDMIFLNTSSVHYYALLLQNREIPVYWWFHESFEQLSTEQRNFVHLGLLSDNFHFCGVTPKVIRGLKELYGVDARLLPMVVKDLQGEDSENNSDKKLVFIPAAYTYIKGQDILMSVIAKLPADILNKTEFVFAGYKLDAQSDYYERIQKISNVLPNVTMLGAITREEVYEYYKKSTCVIAPSRVDSTPTTIVEAMMFSKLCIVSSGAGISELITDCVDGFVFPVEEPDELYKRLLLILTDDQSMDGIRKNGRLLYEKHFSAAAVERYLDGILVE